MNDNEPVAPLGGGGLASPLRIRLDFGYDGTAFSGWAMQPGKRTVEDELSGALTLILRAPKPVRLVVAGRTDAGVHARGAVVHAVSVAPAGFNARFSAVQRRYLYRICDQPELLDPLRRDDTLIHRRSLDPVAMHAAAQQMLGLRDFAAFAKRRDGATTIRTLLEFSWVRAGDGVLEAQVVADAFCRSMVRALVGAVIPVGEGRRPIEWPAQVLVAGRRHPGVVVMPAHGLSLEEVTYPPDAELGSRHKESRVRRIVGD